MKHIRHYLISYFTRQTVRLIDKEAYRTFTHKTLLINKVKKKLIVSFFLQKRQFQPLNVAPVT